MEGSKKCLIGLWSIDFLKELLFFNRGAKLNHLALNNRTSTDRPGRCEPSFRIRISDTTNPVLFSLKGGDPAAPSGTATLLRLRPSYQTRPRRLPPLRVSSATSIVLGFHDVTGGVYKARERIHRSVLTCGY